MAANEADKFKVLAGESRIRIIQLLKRKGPLCVSDLSESLGMTASAVSQHLKILKHAGLVRSERKGYWTHYDVDPTGLEQCNDSLAQVCNCGCHGNCRVEGPESNDAGDDLSSLLERERELLRELQALRARVKERQREV